MFYFILMIMSGVSIGYNIVKSYDGFHLNHKLKIVAFLKNKFKIKNLEKFLKYTIFIAALISSYVLLVNSILYYSVFIIMTIIELIISYIIKVSN